MPGWAEYTSSLLENCFTCFRDHCHAAAERWDYDWQEIRRDARALWDRLHRLRPSDLARVAGGTDWPFGLAGTLLDYPGVAALLRFQARSVSEAAVLRAVWPR